MYFRDHPLTEACRFDSNMASDVENINHLKEGSLYLDQKLTASEIDRISKALEASPNAEFGFEHVSIKVSGGDDFPYEATKPLHIPGDCQRIKLSDCQINSNTETFFDTAVFRNTSIQFRRYAYPFKRSSNLRDQA